MNSRALSTTWRILCLCSLLGVCIGTVRAIDLASAGDWTRTITAADLQAGAGSDLTATYLSDPVVMSLAITGTIDNNDTWRIDVRRTDSNWHNDFTLAIKRTGDGSGGGGIADGDAYRAITMTDASFFTGAGDRFNVPLQLQLTGMSIQAPPATYSTTITFTVVDLGGNLMTVVN